MVAPGDRGVAGLLSALAEAPDFHSAASFFLTQLSELAGTPRACLFQFDAARENLELVASVGFEGTLPPISISAGDLSNPLIIGALTIRPLRGNSPAPHKALARVVPWIALPLSQPRQRGTAEPMPFGRAA